MEVLHDDTEKDTDCNVERLQRVVNEGLVAAVRSADYHTSRQLLILYSLVASRGTKIRRKDDQEIVNVT